MRAAEHDHAKERWIDAAKRRRHQRDRSRAAGGGGLHPCRIEAIVDDQRCAGDDGAGDHGQAPDVRQREARQPSVSGGDAQEAAGGHRRRSDCFVSEHHALGSAGRAAGGHHQRVARLHVATVRQCLPAVVAHDERGSHCCHQRLARRCWQPPIDGKHGVPGIPFAAQRSHELLATGQIDRDQMWHGGETRRE